jgi:hypothetical protein
MARARDRNALALAAGELARIALEKLLDVHEFGRAIDPAFDLGLQHLRHPEAKGDVLVHGEMGKTA